MIRSLSAVALGIVLMSGCSRETKNVQPAPVRTYQRTIDGAEGVRKKAEQRSKMNDSLSTTGEY